MTKAASKVKKTAVDSASPAVGNASEDDRPMTPLMERIRRKSGDGKPLDLNMSATSSVEHGESPLWKKARSDEATSSADSQVFPAVSAVHVNSTPGKVCTSPIFGVNSPVDL